MGNTDRAPARKTVYIAGKITGDPNYKAKFAEAEVRLTQHGFTVLNPAWMPSAGFSYAAYMRIGLAMLKECRYICLLPCWKFSDGAQVEYLIAKKQGKTVIEYADVCAEGGQQ